jgi:hypothetical protein
MSFRRVPPVEYFDCGPFRMRVYPEAGKYEVTTSFTSDKREGYSREEGKKRCLDGAIEICEKWLTDLKKLREQEK